MIKSYSIQQRTICIKVPPHPPQQGSVDEREIRGRWEREGGGGGDRRRPDYLPPLKERRGGIDPFAFLGSFPAVSLNLCTKTT